MKPVILAIVGPSGAGKTFASEFLKNEKGIPVIVSFTTRPMRDGETHGVEHFFVDEEDMPSRSQMLAYTKFGGRHYWTEMNQVSKSGKCLYVIDEKGLIGLIEKYSDTYEIVPILIKRDLEQLLKSVSLERVKRDKSRLTIEDGFYDHIIENDGTVEEFKEKLLLMAKNI
jgi:guanylate kinase